MDMKVSINPKIETALYDLRGKLSIRKIISDTIPRVEFKKLVDEVKEANKDEAVSKAIDDLFKDELLLAPQPVMNQPAPSASLTLADLEAKINSYGDANVSEKASQLGTQKVMTDGHFSGSSSNAA